MDTHLFYEVADIMNERFDIIIVGGGPITDSFARQVQATFAANMMETAQLVQAASQGRIT